MFDNDQFLNTSIEGEMSTQTTPIPVGEYQAFVKGIASRQSPDGEYTMLDVTWQIDDPTGKVEKETGREVSTCRQTIFLDLLDSGALDLGKGRNVGLGRLREAVNQNTGAWSPSMLEGSVAMVKIEHRMNDGNTYADVKGVSKVG